jgi:hypothetical protein
MSRQFRFHTKFRPEGNFKLNKIFGNKSPRACFILPLKPFAQPECRPTVTREGIAEEQPH